MEKNILVLEDNLNWQMLISEMLEKWGYSVFQATSMASALSLLSHIQIQVSIIDICLESDFTYKAGGFEFMSFLENKTPKIKTLILTAYPNLFSEEIALMKHHADKYFSKIYIDEKTPYLTMESLHNSLDQCFGELKNG